MRLPSFTGDTSLYKSRQRYGGYSGTPSGQVAPGVVASQGDPCGCDSALANCDALCALSGGLCLFDPLFCAAFASCLAGCQIKWAICSAACAGNGGGGGGGGGPLCCPRGTSCSCGGTCVPGKGCVGGQCLGKGQVCN